MALFPCKNPNCNSVGKPHPNCRCYPNAMAEGGSVQSFCDSPRSHKKDCEYFAEGGLVDDENDPNRAVAAHLANQGASGSLDQILNQPIEKYYSSIQKGHKNIDSSSQSIFSGKAISEKKDPKSRKLLENWMNEGNTYEDIQNALSQGQDLSPDLLSQIHPQQNLLLQTAKGRISGYLNSIKPQENIAKLAFDDAPDQTEAKKNYEEALNIANSPLSILDHLQKGTIDPLHVKHFSAMYPEVNDLLQKKLTEKIIEAQLNGEKPNYIIRQGLSLLMGTDLSSELKPMNIQAAQATFQSQQAPPQTAQQTSKPKKSTSKLSKTEQSFLTSNQALTSRQQKQ